MTIRIRDQDFGPEEITQVREVLIELRNAALEADNGFEYAIPLSNAIALLHHLRMLESENEDG